MSFKVSSPHPQAPQAPAIPDSPGAGGGPDIKWQHGARVSGLGTQ
jgi:hypothetical protein